MYSSRLLLFITAFAGTSLSQKSDIEYYSSKMSSFFSFINTEGPTTPAAVLSFIATAPNSRPPLATFGPSAHGDEICSIYSKLPLSLLPEFKTYITLFLSFGNAHSDILLGVASDCVPSDQVASPTTAPAPGGAANGTYPMLAAPTATSSCASPTSYTTSIVTAAAAAAARPTGVFLSAAAIGGVLGAAAMLWEAKVISNLGTD
ncbi:hypothetical protein HD806DRAFT_547361 [Xylariaceae sp. AK1471]|nr:hypothetical protein HD806DRAFT_547361 [Xylariaceae sp. AK1471]